jgi:hypothetical protein
MKVHPTIPVKNGMAVAFPSSPKEDTAIFFEALPNSNDHPAGDPAVRALPSSPPLQANGLGTHAFPATRKTAAPIAEPVVVYVNAPQPQGNRARNPDADSTASKFVAVNERIFLAIVCLSAFVTSITAAGFSTSELEV